MAVPHSRTALGTEVTIGSIWSFSRVRPFLLPHRQPRPLRAFPERLPERTLRCSRFRAPRARALARAPAALTPSADYSTAYTRSHPAPPATLFYRRQQM